MHNGSQPKVHQCPNVSDSNFKTYPTGGDSLWKYSKTPGMLLHTPTRGAPNTEHHSKKLVNVLMKQKQHLCSYAVFNGTQTAGT